MRLARLLAVALVPAFLAACTTAPTSQQIAAADYGRNMTQAECIALAERSITYTMIDPGSAMFRHGSCQKGYWLNHNLFGNNRGTYYGWIQTGWANGRNRLGGYTGFQPYTVRIQNGRVVDSCIKDDCT